MEKFNIAAIGECMIELQKSDGGLAQRFGGDTLNTALYLSRLTQNTSMQVSYVTALGCEGFSQNMLDNWQQEGIDTSHIFRLQDKQPGMYYIETNATGERSFYYWRNDAAAKYMFDQVESDYSDCLENSKPMVVRLFLIIISVQNCGHQLKKPNKSILKYYRSVTLPY